ncbi:MAG: ubiquinol-cytochrome c reductase iron-sulfur subunit [Chloroflexi bacterium]|nr:ubiquinol-cytochrome c reductase iron-sulfur subunit [Chloroflexota bacterium]MCL5107487.1 ubiquinol-cytochrome c reductase iron-sulfur subunit [Chloroflexota bacterium]
MATDSEADDSGEEGRRRFLSRTAAVLVTFIGGALAVPTIGHIVSPTLKPADNPLVPLGSVDQFEIGKPLKVDFLYYKNDGWVQERNSASAWVVRKSQSEFVVFDPACTHLGCPYGWSAEQNQFVCPCHGGVFSIDGTVLAGPPPRPLDRFQNSVQDGKLFIRQVVQRG